MGLRYHKSINVGGGLKINLSKNGVGYSWGTKGFRVSKGANGTVRKTYSIPGTGISYVDTSSKSNNKKTTTTNVSTTNTNNKIESFQLVSNSSLYQEDEVTKQINKIRNINILANVLICTIILAIIGLILKLLIKTKWKFIFTYEMDEANQDKYNHLSNFIMSLARNKSVWQVTAKSSNTVIKEKVEFIYKLPWYIESNVSIYSMKLSKDTLYFLPDRILVKKKNGKFTSKSYNNIDSKFEIIKYPEVGYISIDTKTDGYTWQYTNKNGEPDKRYKNNPKMPVCLYGEISLNTIDGLSLLLHTSNSDLMESIENNFKEFLNINSNISDEVISISSEEDKWNNYNDEYES